MLTAQTAVVALLLGTAVAVHRLRKRLVVLTVEGDSMAPAIRHGDRLLSRVVAFGDLVVGDVVALRTPGRVAPSDQEVIVKRIVALPGDAVPEGIPVAEVIVPGGRLLVLGDHSRRSSDSRAFGFVAGSDVVGVVIRRIGAAE